MTLVDTSGVTPIVASQDAGVYAVRNFGGCSEACSSTNFETESQIVSGYLNTADLFPNSTFQNRGMGLVKFSLPSRTTPIIKAELILHWSGYRRLVSRAGSLLDVDNIIRRFLYSIFPGISSVD